MVNSVACKSSSEGTFWTKRLSMTIVACSMLRVNIASAEAEESTQFSETFLNSRITALYALHTSSMHQNSPVVTFLEGLLRRCMGSKQLFNNDKEGYLPPNYFIIREMLCVIRKQHKAYRSTHEQKKTMCYHLKLTHICLQRSTIKISDIYINNEIFLSLTPSHEELL